MGITKGTWVACGSFPPLARTRRNTTRVPSGIPWAEKWLSDESRRGVAIRTRAQSPCAACNSLYFQDFEPSAGHRPRLRLYTLIHTLAHEACQLIGAQSGGCPCVGAAGNAVAKRLPRRKRHVNRSTARRLNGACRGRVRWAGRRRDTIGGQVRLPWGRHRWRCAGKWIARRRRWRQCPDRRRRRELVLHALAKGRLQHREDAAGQHQGGEGISGHVRYFRSTCINVRTNWRGCGRQDLKHS
jgi:hypothetical protein